MAKVLNLLRFSADPDFIGFGNPDEDYYADKQRKEQEAKKSEKLQKLKDEGVSEEEMHFYLYEPGPYKFEYYVTIPLAVEVRVSESDMYSFIDFIDEMDNQFSTDAKREMERWWEDYGRDEYAEEQRDEIRKQKRPKNTPRGNLKVSAYQIDKGTFAELQEFADDNQEGIVLTGCGGDLNEWVTSFTHQLFEQQIASVDNPDQMWSKILVLHTTPDPSDPEHTGGRTDLAFMFPAAEGLLDVGKLAMFRSQMGNASWVSDFVVNYKDQYQGEAKEEEEIDDPDEDEIADKWVEAEFGGDMGKLADNYGWNGWYEPEDSPVSFNEDLVTESFNRIDLGQFAKEEIPKVVTMEATEIEGSVLNVNVGTTDKLTPKEAKALIAYLTGQASDGWGESLEQQQDASKSGRGRRRRDLDVSVHAWWSDSEPNIGHYPGVKIVEGPLPVGAKQSSLRFGDLDALYSANYRKGDDRQNCGLCEYFKSDNPQLRNPGMGSGFCELFHEKVAGPMVCDKFEAKL